MKRFSIRIVLGLLVMLRPFDPASAIASPPNVLFIAVDDLRVELGCMGQTHVKSPNIDRLAAQGTLFTLAYCQQTVCNPSRASVLTGRYPDTLKVWDLVTHFRQHHPDIVTLPQHFRNNGYHAQCVGKIFHNWRQDDWRGDPASWSVPSALHYNNHGHDRPQVAGAIPPDHSSSTLRTTESRDVPDEAYYDGRVAARAIELLQERREADAPFFLAVGFWKPHTPFNAPKHYWDLYDPESLPLPKHLSPPDNVPDIALTQDRFDGAKRPDELRELHHGHLAAISYLDAQVGKVLDALDRLELKDNTIVVFWSDHGLHIGEHGLLRKTTLFELDARVPLIIRAPGMPTGQTSPSLVELIDLYPTLADLCGLAAPKGLEGVSLRPVLSDPAVTVRSSALTQSPRPNYPRGKDQEVMGYSIRTATHRYTEWRDFKTGMVQARELYDHREDPLEIMNLSDPSAQASILKNLAIQLGKRVP